MSARRPVGWGAGLAALLLLGAPACSDPESSSYVSVEVGKLTVDRPAGWATDMTVTAPWAKGFRLRPDSVEQIQISGDFADAITATEAMSTLTFQAQTGGLKGFRIVEARDVEVEGATTARVTRYTITDNRGSQLSGSWITAAHWPYPQSVAVSILTPSPDPDLERRVVESMEFEPVLR